MIVYVETNFILELALLRDDCTACREIIEYSTNSVVKLHIPSFSIGEPYEAWGRRAKSRRELHVQLLREAQELGRSRPYRPLPRETTLVAKLLIESIEDEKRRLEATLKEVLECAKVIPLNAQILRRAVAAQRQHGLKPQDSTVFASVWSDVKKASPGPKCFLNKNSRDFMVPDIEEKLRNYSCKLIATFSDGLSYIKSQGP